MLICMSICRKKCRPFLHKDTFTQIYILVRGYSSSALKKTNFNLQEFLLLSNTFKNASLHLVFP